MLPSGLRMAGVTCTPVPASHMGVCILPTHRATSISAMHVTKPTSVTSLEEHIGNFIHVGINISRQVRKNQKRSNEPTLGQGGGI